MVVAALGLLLAGTADANPNDSSEFTAEVWTFEADKEDILKAGLSGNFDDLTTGPFSSILSENDDWINAVSEMPSYREVFRAKFALVGGKTGEVKDREVFRFPTRIGADGKPAKWDEKEIGMLVRGTLQEADEKGRIEVHIFAEYISFEGWANPGPDASSILVVSDDSVTTTQDWSEAKKIFGDPPKKQKDESLADNETNLMPVFSTHLVDTTAKVLINRMKILGGKSRTDTRESSNGEISTNTRETYIVLILRKEK